MTTPSNKITVNNDLVIYNDLAQTAYIERIQDVVEVFNGASRNTLQLVSELIEGDFRQRAEYVPFGEIRHRNVNSDAEVEPTKIDMKEDIGVKTPWIFPTVAVTKESFKRRARSPEEFSLLAGQMLADKAIAYQISLALGSLEAAIRANPTMVVGGKSIATDGKKVITAGLRKFGDRAERVTALVMNSTRYFDFVDKSIEDKIFEEAGAVVYGGQPGTMGRPVIVTDRCPANLIFGLQPGGATLTESQAPEIASWPIYDRENFAVGFKAEGVLNVDLLGYSYIKAKGENPNITILSDPESWEKLAVSDKATAGVLIDVAAQS